MGLNRNFKTVLLGVIMLVLLSAFFASCSSGQYVGSRLSNKYHNPSCYWAKQIHSDNMIYFSSKTDAANQGYVACKVCKP
jgi:hypothetical protein